MHSKTKAISTVLLLIGLGSCGGFDSSGSPVAPSLDITASKSGYIVVFDKGVPDAKSLALALTSASGSQPQYIYEHAILGFAAQLTDDEALAISHHPLVAYVERDAIVRATAQVLPWGVDRVDADLSSTQAGNGTGAVTGVDVYILDSGVRGIAGLNPPIYHFPYDISGGAFVNFSGESAPYDCNGHGTHVAGIAAAMDNTRDVVGVAPGARVNDIKVLRCDLTGDISGVIAGVDWVTAHRILPAVANMSLRGPASQSLDDAITGSVASGVVYAVAAGNDFIDACNFSPARLGGNTTNGIITVAATDELEAEPDFSNFGVCVDIWAPGVNIVSLKKGVTGGTAVMTGTSQSTPHVTGAAALYLSQHPTSTPAAVEQAIKDAVVTPGTLSKDGRAITRLNVSTF